MASRTRNRWVGLYDRGVLTHHELAHRLVEETTERPTDELVASLPAVAVEVIREQAAAPLETKWLHISSCCTSDPDAWAAAQQESHTRWLVGLEFWRDYFGFNAEQKA
jgi:hypothetical protein